MQMIYANSIGVIDYGEQKSIHSSEKADKGPDSGTVVRAHHRKVPGLTELSRTEFKNQE